MGKLIGCRFKNGKREFGEGPAAEAFVPILKDQLATAYVCSSVFHFRDHGYPKPKLSIVSMVRASGFNAVIPRFMHGKQVVPKSDIGKRFARCSGARVFPLRELKLNLGFIMHFGSAFAVVNPPIKLDRDFEGCALLIAIYIVG